MPKRITSLFLCAASALVVISMSQANAQQLKRHSTARVLMASQGHNLGRPQGINSKTLAVPTAQAFLAQHPELNPRGSTLKADQSLSLSGHKRVRLIETYNGIPVMGGETVVVMNSQNEILAASSESLPGDPPANLSPAINSTKASQLAISAVGRDSAGLELHTTKLKLVIFNPGLFGAPGPAISRLVWQAEVVGTQYRHMVLVDAHFGVTVLNLDLNQQIKSRKVCDANNGDILSPCIDSIYPSRQEGDPATGITDVDNAYDFSGGVYDFYYNLFGRDSINGLGMPLVSVTRVCPPSDCPFQNAYWDGTQMVYGEGFASADDVVGHELTHGVTESTSQLVYYYQSGAINEAMSDIMGEFFDLQNSAGNDSSDARWKMGEDLPSSIGIIRDMKNPPAYNQPDAMTSSLYDLSGWDSGGVHTNSGVANKAAYLLTDGDTFNGQTVQGIGATKASRLFYDVNTQYLRTGSDFIDLAQALQSACSAGIGSLYTADDCSQVDKTIQATAMTSAPAGTEPTPECPGNGTKGSTAFHDDFSDPSQWQSEDLVSSTNGKWYSSVTTPDAAYGKDNKNMYIPDTAEVSDNTLKSTASFLVPENGALRIRHSFAFDKLGDSNYDGGVVEYSNDNGATWNDIESLAGVHAANGYGGDITSKTSPITGRKAFVGTTPGYTESAWSLTALAGQNIKLRFRFASDKGYSNVGWFIDDMSIYSCAPDVVVPSTWATADSEWSTTNKMSLTFGASEKSTFECSLDNAAWAACVSPATFEDLSEGPHQVRVRAIDLADNVDASPAVVDTKIDMTFPSTLIATAAHSSGHRSVAMKLNASETISNMSCNIDQQGWQDCGVQNAIAPLLYSIDTGLLADGLHTIQIKTTDLAGNQEAVGVIIPFVMDATAPKLKIKGNLRTSRTRPRISFSSNEPATYSCSFDRKKAKRCASSWRPIHKLKRGLHSLTVTATDSNGNIKTTRFVFRIIK